jgi:hypothetical protein
MPRHTTAESLGNHRRISELLYAGLTQAEASRVLMLPQSTISHHANHHCKCDAPRYVYVPESWFVCRKCKGGWRTKNGCEHSWELVLA